MDCKTLQLQSDKLAREVYQGDYGTEDPSPQQFRNKAGAAHLAAEQCVEHQPTIQTSIDLNGSWASGGVPGPYIRMKGNSMMIDMSSYPPLYKVPGKKQATTRPAANGLVLDPQNILVNFPDDDGYTGQLQSPNTILWSNKSTWTKV